MQYPEKYLPSLRKLFCTIDGHPVWGVRFDANAFIQNLHKSTEFVKGIKCVLHGNGLYHIRLISWKSVKDPKDLEATYAITDLNTGTVLQTFNFKDGDWLVIDDSSGIFVFSKYTDAELYKTYRHRRIPQKG